MLLLSCAEKKEKEFTAPEIIVVENIDDENHQMKPLRVINKSRRDSVIAFAEQYLGTKYCYAGNNPKTGFDCSGYVNFVFNHFDIDLPRSSSQFKDLGTALAPEDFREGDVLVFYGYQDNETIGHVGIVYEASGMDSKFIHASSGSEYAVTISNLGSNAYSRRFYKCINVIETPALYD
ncbi:C40 family peptidase [Flavobacterium salilacus subsp. salilacus]|nr:C40 family peptidase [Flavobacterium salilacus subsp. salilacus]MBE1613795.1 C40 family peptidase [Flavobacterium sp. SaA2.13]